ncbi:E3 ubiquitin-protein ligase SIAH1-like [Sitophilus oryzae]|uniref:E3 ubiquitin-protein ligase n=1 Tax=Sitophilus oryzae TaxID=7048 RepID=A0A6J2XFE8_SITOR|nr:E3 ubiquitin-protein ligase SIAH1-like [Sitophilus oryzae]XP_030749474.1 E3 ubiquitin-protein ligase SIAH1-like [Sitophilus oryzae]
MASEDLAIIKENLLCPVCTCYMSVPIRQCKTGHSLCDQCFTKVKHCPKCRGPKSTARCFTLEAIASKIILTCRFKDEGCLFSTLGDAMAEHERQCRYGLICCPFKTYDHCKWTGYMKKLENHCMRKHTNNFYSKEKQKFISKSFKEVDSYYYIYVIIHAYDEFFRLTWELDDETGITKWAIYFMGTKEMAEKFTYKIEFTGISNSEYSNTAKNIVWKSPCSVLPDVESVKFVGNDYLMVHRDLLNTFCDENGDLNYTTFIYKSESLKKHRKASEPELERVMKNIKF